MKRETFTTVSASIQPAKIDSVINKTKGVISKEAITSTVELEAVVNLNQTQVETVLRKTINAQSEEKLGSDSQVQPTKSETVVTEAMITEISNPVTITTTHEIFSSTEQPTEVESLVTKTAELSGINLHKTIPTSIVESIIIKEKPSVEFSTKVIETTYMVTSKEVPVVSEVTKNIKDFTTEEYTETRTQKIVSESKFDISKIRTDTLGKFDFEDISNGTKEAKKYVPTNLDLKEVPEITKEQVQPVIDDIIQKGSMAAAARSPIIEKDIKLTAKDMESEKRSYDAKVPAKDERRHSCISPAISLERIAESDVETDDEPPTPVVTVEEKEQSNIKVSTAIKKSDSAMKQMADNIEIIIKQASEEVDMSSEEHIVEEPDPQDISGRVSVDSIIEEAVTTVESYLDQKEDEIATKKEMMYEETKRFIKERPGLTKSLSRDSGETVIMPKKKHARTFSVQSSPEEVEEQIYTDSESG